MLPYRGRLTLIFFSLALTSGVFLPGLWGLITAPIFIVLALFLWVIPTPQLKTHDKLTSTDPQLQHTSRMILGVGLGLLAAIILPFLPGPGFWIAMGAGGIVIGYFIVRLLQNR